VEKLSSCSHNYSPLAEGEATMNIAKSTISLVILASAFISSNVLADTSIPLTNSLNTELSKHKLFLNSQNTSGEGFDVWRLDSGYAYNVYESVDLYIGTRVENSDSTSSGGFLSGVSYQFNEHVSLKSALYQSDSIIIRAEDKLAAEVSGQIQITDKLNIHATYDYADFQQGIEVGLGFSF
jgi:hypothetical protein